MENELFCTERSCPFENCEKHWKHLIGKRCASSICLEFAEIIWDGFWVKWNRPDRSDSCGS